MTFEDYLIGKKIDSRAFSEKENDLWDSWRLEFEQMHHKSFTAQKLYLINPIRRKYPLREEHPVKVAAGTNEETTAKKAAQPAKPSFKVKPKFK